MDRLNIQQQALQRAKEAFETACRLDIDERVEVYLHSGRLAMSDVLTDDEEMVYEGNRHLLYRIFGHNYLEPEIKTWIDFAREEKSPADIEKAIIEIGRTIARNKGVAPETVHSFEIFANLPMDLLAQIENVIIDYWWDGAEGENGKSLAKAQIDEALEGIS